ncbi:alpha/beta-hydrolase [Athelia psychrophila]|uniref:Alpha/beta-hydrolase n=1 Tax=Athelia psychrophila TaxID=1759441 RepID=A0A166EDR2_9AGAM|nr:alpha/beta-hydrolase [Fibularhizoctonia sp. CBS 109695]
MLALKKALASAVLAGLAAQAAPSLYPRQTTTALSTAQIAVFTPYTWYASTGYCEPTTTIGWSCGANCEANPTFQPVASGGDGDAVQYWFVGYDPTLKTVIVSHQGTNPTLFLPDLTDIDFFLTELDTTLFAGVSSSVEVHNGFAHAQSLTATEVLAAVKTAMALGSTTTVTVTGHSLGAAISLLDSVYLPLHLPSGTTFKTVVYGLPRVGNQAFADYVDANLHLTHINNLKDPVPLVPLQAMGFVHPAGEVHIDPAEWASCSGQENPSALCEDGYVTLLTADLDNHSGPYNGVTMGC